MTVAEVIRLVDGLKPNMYTVEQKVGWLNTLDGMLFRDVILTHEHEAGAKFTPYDHNGDLKDNLIAPAPYDQVYTHWLASQIDLNNGEIEKYNENSALYNMALDTFMSWYNRYHMPLTRVKAIRI